MARSTRRSFRGAAWSRRAAWVLAAGLASAPGCSVDTGKFAGLRPCVAAQDDCGAGHRCVQGYCARVPCAGLDCLGAACAGDADCPPGAACAAGACAPTPCAVPGDCGDDFAFTCEGAGCAAVPCDPVAGDPAACGGAGWTCTDLGACARCVPDPAGEGAFGLAGCGDGRDGDCDGAVDAADLDCAPPCADDAHCDDGDACDGAERCVDGACRAGEPIDCAALDDPAACLRGACLDGACRAEPLPDGAPCQDGRHCTGDDRCQRGVCVGGGAPACDDGDVCTLDRCDLAADACAHEPAPASDVEGPRGDARCADGRDNDCDGAIDAADDGCYPCADDAGCDDGDPCTLDRCDGAAGCAHPPVPDGDAVACDDGDACTGPDLCSDGRCRPGAATVCPDDGNPCTDERCRPGDGACVVAFNQAPCEEVFACSTGDRCRDGACQPGAAAVCPDEGDPCTAAVCAEPGGCAAVPQDGGDCQDGDPCTDGDRCAGGRCAGVPRLCGSDGDPCTADACDPATGACFAPLPDGAPCPDGDACDGAETCGGGVCREGAPVLCGADGDPCTVDACDPATGACWPAEPDGTACDNGVFCDGPDTCRSGACVSPGDPCVDGVACTIDACDEDEARCRNVPDDGRCGAAEVCAPACFAGSGCGAPPGAVAVACPAAVTAGNAGLAATCDVTLAGGTVAGQAPCLACRAVHGSELLAYADFAECAAGCTSVDGWSCDPDARCAGDVAGAPALESSNAAANDVTVAISRTWTTAGLDRAWLCLRYASVNADEDDGLTIELAAAGCDPAIRTVLADDSGAHDWPEDGDTPVLLWSPYCLDLGALDECLLDASPVLATVTLQTIRAASSAGVDRLLIDDIGLYGWDDDCVREHVAFSSTFPCRGGVADAEADGWTRDSGNEDCPCTGADGAACAHADLARTNDEWVIRRVVDVSNLVGDVFVEFDWTEVFANENSYGLGPDAFIVQFRTGATAPWQTAFHHTGDVTGGDAAETRRFRVPLSAIDPAVQGARALEVRFWLRANGDAGYLYLDNVRIGTVEYRCDSGEIRLGAIAEAAGEPGRYLVPLTAIDTAHAQLECRWDGPRPPPPARDSLEFRP